MIVISIFKEETLNLFKNKKIVSVTSGEVFISSKSPNLREDDSIISLKLEDDTVLHFHHHQTYDETFTIEGFESLKELEGQPLLDIRKKRASSESDQYLFLYFHVQNIRKTVLLKFKGSCIYYPRVELTYKNGALIENNENIIFCSLV